MTTCTIGCISYLKITFYSNDCNNFPKQHTAAPLKTLNEPFALLWYQSSEISTFFNFSKSDHVWWISSSHVTSFTSGSLSNSGVIGTVSFTRFFCQEHNISHHLVGHRKHSHKHEEFTTQKTLMTILIRWWYWLAFKGHC